MLRDISQKIKTCLSLFLFLLSCESSIVTTSKKGASVPCDDPNLAFISIETSVTLCDGSVVAGQMTECSKDGQSNCIATSAFPAIKLSDIGPGSIRDGITIAGVEGKFPSVNHPIKEVPADTVLLHTVASQAVAKTTNAFYFDANGTFKTVQVMPDLSINPADPPTGISLNFYSNASVAKIENLLPGNIKAGVSIFGVAGTAAFESLDPWDLRAGVSVGPIEGKIKANCRTQAHLANWDFGPINTVNDNADGGQQPDADGVASWWDTINNFNFTNAGPPEDNPWPDEHFCDESVWEAAGVDSGNTDGYCNDSSDECIYFDKISRVYLTEDQGDFDWAAGLRHCDGLNGANYGGFSTGWRMPTQIELFTAVVHGIFYLKSSFFIDDMDSHTQSATTESAAAHRNSNAWAHRVKLRDGTSASNGALKTDALQTVCIRYGGAD